MTYQDGTRRVLIVSYEPHTTEEIGCELAQHKYVVNEARGFQEAKDLLSTIRFDAILYGSELGIELAREIKSRTNGTPIIPIATGFEGTDYEKMPAVFAKPLYKPWSRQQLLHVLDNAINGAPQPR